MTGKNMKIAQKRWNLAQESEADFWETIKSKSKSWEAYMIFRQNAMVDLMNFVSSFIPFKSHDRILDIGCGPIGVLNHINIGERYGIDSFIVTYLPEFKTSKEINYAKGIAENLPFKSECFDYVEGLNT